MFRTGDRRSPRGTIGAVGSLAAGLLVLVAAGATCSSESQPGSKPASSSTGAAGADEAGSAVAQPRVGNPSNTGMDTVPDWNALAVELRERVGPRMPDPLPTDLEGACAGMLDEALAFYVETELNPEHQKRLRAQMADTRNADFQACVAETSIAAATCVTILLGDRNAEFPWLLDQCSRAYPRAEGRARGTAADGPTPAG